MHEENRDTRITPAAPERADTGSRHSPGDTLAGRFVLHERLGSGGSGTVFSALDTRVGDRVAVKILDRATHDPANRERLRREIRATRSGHPNVVSIHELHEGDGVLFITMELVEGSSLRETLAERSSLIVDDVVLIGRRIASALDHLHAQGLVHRDVKPGNIMLTREGRAKLCDMGLARPLEAGATVTESEMVVGTPTYMAPEMARSGELVAASDVYALGLTLYQCLSGEVPLAGTTAVDTLMARQKARPRSVRALRPECPRWLGRLLDRMLDPDPSLRPSAQDVDRSLNTRRFAWRPHRRYLGRTAAAAGIILLAAAAVGLGLRVGNAPPDPADDPVANELMVSIERFDDGTMYKIVDGHGRPVHTLTTGAGFHELNQKFFLNRHVSFADFDGDGRRDVVFGIQDTSVERQLEFYTRQPDGGIQSTDAWNIHLEVAYDSEVFGTFLPGDVRCADLSGNGRPEIIVAQSSVPFYPGAVRVFDLAGRELLRVLHPGRPTNTLVGDRDGDGRGELYVGATNNFLAEIPGRESSPVVFSVETDWDRPGQVLDFFARDRRLTERVPAGMDVVYLTLAKQRRIPTPIPWRYAALRMINPGIRNHFLEVFTDRILLEGWSEYSAARTFYFDDRLRMANALWDRLVLEEHGIDPDSVETPEDLSVTYWNGTAWQPEVCPIPQAE